MHTTALKKISKPVKMKVTRIDEIFENTNPYNPNTYMEPVSFNTNKSIIKNYNYSADKVYLTE